MCEEIEQICIVGLLLLAKKFSKNGQLDSRLGLQIVETRASKLCGPLGCAYV